MTLKRFFEHRLAGVNRWDSWHRSAADRASILADVNDEVSAMAVSSRMASHDRGRDGAPRLETTEPRCREPSRRSDGAEQAGSPSLARCGTRDQGEELPLEGAPMTSGSLLEPGHHLDLGAFLMERGTRSWRHSGTGTEPWQAGAQPGTYPRPAFSCSRSMLSKSARKLPAPKPSSPLRWMISKKNGPAAGSL